MNMTLYPYKKGDVWVFDDPATELKEEAFVAGMSEMITRMVDIKQIPNANKGIAITFGLESFEGKDAKLTWLQDGEITFKNGKEDVIILSGNWYHSKIAGKDMVGWLCPALLKYFQIPPKTFYAGVAPLPKDVDPIWHNAPKKKMAFVQG